MYVCMYVCMWCFAISAWPGLFCMTSSNSSTSSFISSLCLYDSLLLIFISLLFHLGVVTLVWLRIVSVVFEVNFFNETRPVRCMSLTKHVDTVYLCTLSHSSQFQLCVSHCKGLSTRC